MSATEGRPRKTRQPGPVVRAAIVDAAIAAINEQGFIRFSTDDVARRAGISQGGLFRHFATRAELIAAVAEATAPASVDDLVALSDRFVEVLAMPVEERFVNAILLAFDLMTLPSSLTAIELGVAARTDAALAVCLGRLADPGGDVFAASIAAIYPEFDDHPSLGLVGAIVFDMLRGFLLTRITVLDTDRQQHHAELEVIARFLLTAFGPMFLRPGD